MPISLKTIAKLERLMPLLPLDGPLDQPNWKFWSLDRKVVLKDRRKIHISGEMTV